MSQIPYEQTPRQQTPPPYTDSHTRRPWLAFGAFLAATVLFQWLEVARGNAAGGGIPYLVGSILGGALVGILFGWVGVLVASLIFRFKRTWGQIFWTGAVILLLAFIGNFSHYMSTQRPVYLSTVTPTDAKERANNAELIARPKALVELGGQVFEDRVSASGSQPEIVKIQPMPYSDMAALSGAVRSLYGTPGGAGICEHAGKNLQAGLAKSDGTQSNFALRAHGWSGEVLACEYEWQRAGNAASAILTLQDVDKTRYTVVYATPTQ